MTVSTQDGYLSSHVTETSGAGSVDCPWNVRAELGQRIKLTLLDFSGLTGKNPTSQQCNVYATIKEPTAGVSETVCGTRERVTIIYTSDSNQVQVRLVPRGKDNKAFVIRHQGMQTLSIE